MERFHFPAWVNTLLPVLAGVIVMGVAYTGCVVVAAVYPVASNQGYRPEQPVPFSHAIHAGKLKMDCRYCHNTVEVAAHAAIPPVATCLNCHRGKDGDNLPKTVAVHYESVKLLPIRNAAQNDQPVKWRKVHDLADYVYFNHSVHVNSGVSCVVCHGRIDTLEVVEQKKTLVMGYCISCHRNPEPNLRPVDQVTNLSWKPETGTDAKTVGKAIAEDLKLHPKENCSTCHR
jgi:hypothetical protein